MLNPVNLLWRKIVKCNCEKIRWILISLSKENGLIFGEKYFHFILLDFSKGLSLRNSGHPIYNYISHFHWIYIIRYLLAAPVKNHFRILTFQQVPRYKRILTIISSQQMKMKLMWELFFCSYYIFIFILMHFILFSSRLLVSNLSP